MTISITLLKDAHKACSYHRDALMKSDRCGCFYCQEVYDPEEIREWTDRSQTAVCPKCGIDSVLPSESANGYVLDAVFLNAMHEYWFE